MRSVTGIPEPVTLPRLTGPHPMSGVDLSDTRLRNVEFIGVDLGTRAVDIRFPTDDDHWTIPSWPDFLRRVDALVGQLAPDDDQLVAKIWLDYAQAATGPSQASGFISLWDLQHLGGQNLVNLLHQTRRS